MIHYLGEPANNDLHPQVRVFGNRRVDDEAIMSEASDSKTDHVQPWSVTVLQLLALWQMTWATKFRLVHRVDYHRDTSGRPNQFSLS